ncbi:acyl--CoA ligase [Rhodococcus sp. D2-41]|uniref:class I adenylate-forming enzyme family protein n=1 Tax=Speluncibacter jeojiensis TaxID=2710754 RepID=UPI00240FF484|nr:class I adenylate-forming enzyme family protein [Rhodococcus sp. D2-41]MDG3008573.1 acyl--CoA ligase [Rhodococcus sp. D2-41]
MGTTATELRTLAEYVTHHAAHTPAQPVTWFEDEVLDYGALDQRVDELARALIGAGIRPGERVAVLSTPRPEFLVTLLAAMRVGAVWVGLNPRYTYRELAHVVGDCEPSLLLSLAAFEDRNYTEDTARLLADFPSVRAAYRLDAGPTAGPLTSSGCLLEHAVATDDNEYAARRAAVQPDDAAVIVYTSGSSGAPKGAMLAHEGLVYAFRTEAEVLDIDRPRVPCNLPINHIACIGDICGTTLVAGGMVAFLERFSAQELLDRIEELQLTSLLHVPTVLQLVAAQEDFADRNLSCLRAVVWGGAPLPAETLAAYRALGVRLMTVYGMTETSASITWTDPTATDEVLATTVGRPDPDMDVRIVTDDGHDALPGESGEIWVRHRCLMKGYFRRPEATHAAFTPAGYFRTGDVAELRPDGNLRLVGRRTEMYKSGGYNIYPREIELALEEHPAVTIAAVIGVPDPVFTEVGAAFVVLHPRADLDSDTLRKWLRNRLANYKVPKRITFLDALPLLPVGKVDKQALRALPPPTTILETGVQNGSRNGGH